jgi:Holliday junction resolvase RusA-like endonuclease
MKRLKKYHIPVSPIAWQRPRLNGQRFYDAQTHDKLAFGLYLNQQHDNEPLFTNPIHITISFNIERPRTIAKREQLPYPSRRPDLDNFCKFLLDSIQGVLITDDKIVCSLTAHKRYTRDASILIEIEELELNEQND